LVCSVPLRRSCANGHPGARVATAGTGDDPMDYVPLNIGLMSNPANWVIVTLMVMIGGFALALLTSLSPKSAN
jgi:hypothetical protein